MYVNWILLELPTYFLTDLDLKKRYKRLINIALRLFRTLGQIVVIHLEHIPMNLNLFAGLYRIKSFLEQIEPQLAGQDPFNLKKTRTTLLVLISFWPQLKAHLIKDQVMNITKETEVVNLRQKGGKIISEDNLDYFFVVVHNLQKTIYYHTFLCLR